MSLTASRPKVNETFRITPKALDIPERLLLGPGPSNSNPDVVAAMNRQPIGHLDPVYLDLMDEVQAMMRYVWQTENPMTLPISGTGSAAMEATLANTIEPGDVVLVGINGYFGNRLFDMAGRYRADVRSISKPWGEVFSLSELRAALEEHRPAILALVHAETSTGARQPLEGVGDLCREFDCLLLVDTVTSLGGVPIFLDEWKVDMAYSCSQKGLSCPPGSSPFTMGERALQKLDKRQTKVANWYLDISLLRNYWGQGRTYHHTAPVNMTYAIREALRLVLEEGLENSWDRHQQTAEKLWDGLAELGLSCHVPKEYRLPTLTTVKVPEGVDAKAVTSKLLKDHNIEIGNGLGELGGKVWRIGLMGYNSQPENVDRLLAVWEKVMADI
ncbi:alanine--glyoxylate aminotransferase family protein [Leptolyngbyaceae cyanobacterium CCMR0082]|uniref:Alanine--glyoxylate aminotransferase family protein n=2 Tax=Adonisia turfae TaxID=2950184 RepID=A0A6M0S4W5_9CYAN|nr:alanine--glyoxylate aminotransferase family protein [Adonisia turfae]NEZ55594.1 alanine--glyoxylate aminotransferase family protein [Adonisia turfae CCMR0081]NEZ63425.1 alanine--glyoxylate aminotransferase family protein [Adonisia turfae CCMR0082]